MKPEDIHIGMQVDIVRFDGTEPSWKRLGICTVVAVICPAVCESGTLVDIRKHDGTVIPGFCANWLTEVTDA